MGEIFLKVEDFSSVLFSYLHEPYASLLNGIIFGIDLKVAKDFYTDLKRVGLLHIVVLSGMNLSLLSAIISRFTIFFGRKTSSLITIFVLILFIIWVGPEAPIVRAGIMAVLTHVAIIYGVQAYSLYLLFLSGVFSLIFKPEWIRSISFQLSYLATLGIILFSKSYRREESFWKSLIRDIKLELRTSLSAQIFTAPLIFIYFKQISVVSPLANVLVAPIIAPVMILGFLAAFLGKLNFYLGLPFSWLAFGLLRYVVFITETLSSVPFSFFEFEYDG